MVVGLTGPSLIGDVIHHPEIKFLFIYLFILQIKRFGKICSSFLRMTDWLGGAKIYVWHKTATRGFF